ncbi:MAG: Smr/MutS family protein [Candidatus Accumulibacter sp.]|jgi:DNA-nicking Smr family endonuclease|nr:Smr/MutS family protein [Accumulibacter sp.]
MSKNQLHQPSPEEIADFHAAVAGVSPLKTAERVVHERAKPSPRPRQSELDEAAVAAESLRGSFEIDELAAIGEANAFLRPGLPRSVLRDLRRGRWTIRNHIDLHGANRHQAREEVARFLAESVREGKRCVRIVHGRGHGSPGHEGILRQLVKSWLSRSHDVLAFCHPPPSDGGEGALWILLRSPRF